MRFEYSRMLAYLGLFDKKNPGEFILRPRSTDIMLKQWKNLSMPQNQSICTCLRIQTGKCDLKQEANGVIG